MTDSLADASGAASDAAPGADTTIHLHFPIDVQIVGGAGDDIVDQVVAQVFDELRRELERRG